MTYKRGEVKTRELRQLVATRKQAFEQQQKRIREEQQRKAAIEQKKVAEARKAEEERERQQRDAEIKKRQEERLKQIKREQQEARKKIAMESIMVSDGDCYCFIRSIILSMPLEFAALWVACGNLHVVRVAK